jgi:hypothetical protein
VSNRARERLQRAICGSRCRSVPASARQRDRGCREAGSVAGRRSRG